MLENIRHIIRHGRNAVGSGAVKRNIPSGVPPTPAAESHHSEYLKPVAENIVNEEIQSYEKRKQEVHQSIENYTLGEKLGEGAFSVVYAAINKETKEKVAIKVIKKYQLDEKQKANVMKEVNLMSQLNHPNVVKLIDFIENDHYYFIIQELVSGGEIFNEIIKYTYFSEDLSRHVIIQVAEALLYMHEIVGIVHRDLKPENIFFKPVKFIKDEPAARFKKLRKSDNPKTKVDEGRFVMNYGGGGIGLIKIGDFGLSKQISLDQSNSLKTPCGTIGYTAPEIVRDQRYSKEVDMWALGCVLYILLCGFPPFFNDNIEELTKTVARGEFKFLTPWWDEISDGAKNCVSRLLTVNPGERYNVEQFLNDPWIVEFLNRSENLQAQAQSQAQTQVQVHAPFQTQTQGNAPIQTQSSEVRSIGTPALSSATNSDGSDRSPETLTGEAQPRPNKSYSTILTVPEDLSPFDSDIEMDYDFGVELRRGPELIEESLEPAPASTTHRVSKSQMNRKKESGRFTPEVMAMRDMFDMSLAAHRMHEERKGRFTPSKGIIEEDEDGEESGALKDAPAGFTLNMNDASILARRRKV